MESWQEELILWICIGVCIGCCLCLHSCYKKLLSMCEMDDPCKKLECNDTSGICDNC